MTSVLDGFTNRPLSLDDAGAVAELIAAEERHDVGEVDTTVEDVVGDWQRPSYDIASSTLGVFDGGAEGGRLVAYADLHSADLGYTGVLPDERGRGLGTALADWLEDLARQRGSDLLSTQVAAGGAADRLLAARGYRERWRAWDLELPEGAEIEAQPLPAGYTLREATEADHETVWAVIEDAFTEWARPERRPFADFAALVWKRPGHQPWHLRLVLDSSGEIVGATQVYLTGDAGYVSRLAVRRDRRGLGLARAMLAEAFAQARERGAVRCYLATDSRSGALGLYEKVGMRVSSTWVNRARDL